MTSSLLSLTPARLCLDPRRNAGVFLSLFVLFLFCVFVCVKAPTARYKNLGLQRRTQPTTTCPCFVVWPGVAAHVRSTVLHIIQGGPEKNAQNLMQYNFSTTVHRVTRFLAKCSETNW